MHVAGKRVLVTGGAGGLGSAICADLADGGATVCALDREGAVHPTSGHPKVSTVNADLTSEASVQTALADVAARMPALDGLVLAAGVQLHGRDGPVGEVPIDVWHRTIAVNLTGCYLTLRFALPLLLAAGRSSVVFLGSPTGLTMSGAGYAAYAASKAGMMGLARVLAADYAGRGLRANVVVPGTMRTRLTESLLADPATSAALVAALPIGRIGEPSDLTGICRWLISDASSFATGGFFPVDGGLTAR